MEIVRAFIAIDTGSSVHSGLAGLEGKLKHIRWVKPDLLHLTLAFRGHVAAKKVPAAERGTASKLPIVGTISAYRSGSRYI